jgi:hypothetical protein
MAVTPKRAASTSLDIRPGRLVGVPAPWATAVGKTALKLAPPIGGKAGLRYQPESIVLSPKPTN